MRLVYVALGGMALFVLIVAGFFGYQVFLAPVPPTPTVTPRPAASVPVNAEGRVAPAQDALMAFALAGRVERVLVAEGDVVSEGDLLLVLESATLRAQANQAAAALDAARAQQDLLPSSAEDEEEALAQAMVDQAEAALDAATRQLEQTDLRAPFGGTVISIEIEPGEVVGAGLPVLVLADTSRWQVETLDVLEQDAVRLRIGGPALVEFAAYPDHQVSGTVERVALNASAYRGNVTYTVTIALPADPGLDLSWGMTAFVEIQPSETAAVSTSAPNPTAEPGASPTHTPSATAAASRTPTPTSTATAAAVARVHVVAAGETLFRIALQYGVTVEALKAANDLADNLIYVGQRLAIPAP